MKRIFFIYIVALILVSCNSTESTGVKKVTYNFRSDLRQELSVLYQARDTAKRYETTVIGGFEFGLAPFALIEQLQDNGISDLFFPEYYTRSQLIIGEHRYMPKIKYGFGDNNELRYVEMLFGFEFKGVLLSDLMIELGMNAIYAVDSFSAKNKKQDFLQVWFDGNHEYSLSYKELDGYMKLCICEVDYGGNINTAIMDHLKTIYNSYDHKGSEVCLQYDYGGSIFSSGGTIKYNGDDFVIIDSRDNSETISESGMRERFYSKRKYQINASGYVYVLNTPNGSRVKNPTGVLSPHYCMTSNDEVFLLEMKGDWVKVMQFQHHQNKGWIRKSIIKKPSYLTIAEPMKCERYAIEITTPKTTSTPSFSYEEYQKKQDDYYRSVNREKAMRDAGLKEYADREKKERIEKLQSGEYRF